MNYRFGSSSCSVKGLVCTLPSRCSNCDGWHWWDSNPPYFKRMRHLRIECEHQTIYAKSQGAVAAPTAGLHFLKHYLISSNKNHFDAFLTLHVGIGTFRNLRGDIEAGKLHSERYFWIRSMQKKFVRQKKRVDELLPWVRQAPVVLSIAQQHGEIDRFRRNKALYRDSFHFRL